VDTLLKYFTEEELEQSKEWDLYFKSLSLVLRMFFFKKDKAGKPYVNHLLRVSDSMTTIDGKVAGLLHDVVEDIEDVTFEDLIEFGIPKHIIEVLKLVTKEKVNKPLTQEEKLQKYNEEIDRIIASQNLLALELKIADMSDNYNEDRLKQLDEEKQKWFNEKYGENIKRLRKERMKYDRY